MFSTRRTLTFCCLLAFAALPTAAQPLPCRPCAGLRVETALAGEALEALAGALPAGQDATVVLAWEAPLNGSADPAPLERAAALAPPPAAPPPAPAAPAPRLIPWLTLPFRTPPPLAQQAVRLQGELDAVSRLAAAAPPGAFFQIVWRPEGVDPAAPLDFAEYAFLLKRAAVAVTGARPDGRVVTQPLRAGGEAIEALYAQEVAAYLEAVAVLPGRPEAVAATAAAVERLDPGRLVVVDAPPLPGDPQTLPAEAARWAVRGASLVLFRVEREQPPPANGSGGAPEASPAPAEASAPAQDASALAQDASALAQEASGLPQEASGPPQEASPPAPEASGLPQEASSAPPEASAPPQEASPSPPEASAPPREASAPPPEASAAPPEASAASPEASAASPEASSAPPEAASTPADTSAAPGEAPSLPESFFQALTPLSVLAREFAGDLSYDPTSSPQGPGEAWAFVRGEDLALRVIAVTPAAPQVDLRFPDPLLGSPVIVDAPTGRTVEAVGNRVGNGFTVRLYQPRPVTLLRLERVEQVELEAVKERVTVAGEREVPVEEILRRLQAFEDAQARRLQRYRAVNTTHLRFQVGASSQSFEATLQGPFFWTPESGADWVWQDLFVNGVRWRAKTIPEIPLVQPEKAAAMPLEIHFTRQYRYRLRGSEKIDGRDAWVVDFAPTALETGEGGKLYQGTVWVDKQLSSRLRTRAVQVGLEGEVISNEETLHYTPIDAAGQAVPWETAGSFVLPLRIVAQQILSVVNAATVVERETNLTAVRINDPEFEQARQAAAESDLTMVRDTPQGLRYLVKDEATGERVVKEGFDSNKLFLLGGVFYDDALDFPLPLAGINYFSFDFRGTGQQLNAFFGGALLTVDIAEPRLFGSRFDAGADFFALAVPLADTVWRDDDEVHEEEVETRSGNVGFKLGRPLGNFVKVSSEYTLAHHDYGTTDNTAAGFVPPGNHLTHSLQLNGRFARAGWRVGLEGSLHRRSEWEPWGLPDNPDFFAEAQDYSLWGATLSKNWHLPHFQKIGAEVNYLGGSDLDRFSKYEFGFFGASRVHGYQSGRVRANEVTAGHLSYGFEIGEAFRLEAVADAALATDEDAGLDQELLAGLGVNGTFLGPWQTVVNLDVGVPVQGPDDGFVLYVVFLKLFR